MENHEDAAPGRKIAGNNEINDRQRHERALVARAERFYWIDQIRKTYTKKGRFEKSFLSLDYENEEGQSMQASDGGRCAAAIRTFDEPEEPAWLLAFDEALAQLEGSERTLAYALLEYVHPARVARLEGVSRMTVYRVLHKLRASFEKAYRLYLSRNN